MKTKDNQSLLDLAIQTGGSVESVFDLASKNNLSITGQLNPNQEVVNPSIVSTQVKDYYKVKGLTPATDASLSESQLKGIGNMVIQQSFKVK